MRAGTTRKREKTCDCLCSRGGQIEQGRSEGLVLGKLLADLDPFAQKQARFRGIRDLGYYACDERRKRLGHLPWRGRGVDGSIAWRLSVPPWQATRLLVAQGNGLKVLAVVLLGKRQRLGGCHLKRERVQRGCGAIVAGSLAARRNPSSARVGACAVASGSHSGLHKARAAPTCGSPSALFPTMMRGRPGLAASTCGHWDECELRGSAQFGERGG